MQVVRRLGALTMAVLIGFATLGAAPASAVTTAEKQAILYRELGSAAVFWDMYSHRTVAPNNEFNWGTDFCSKSPDRPLGFDFTGPCRRHDFNYNNFKINGIFTSANRLAIDKAFKADMYAVCARYSYLPRKSCEGTATTYYTGVRTFGWL
ncbi:MAG: secreted protein [Acidimicrobiales bacterium]|nr:secreted protein [Acidimicrobiales bacterium]